MQWQIRDQTLELDRPLVMGILNVTPDSFSDGGQFYTLDGAIRQAEQMVADGVDILDIGGESTRPGSLPVSPEEEICRVIPVIRDVSKRFDIPVSVDTTKSVVAQAAVEAGAQIINDISGLRFDEDLAAIAAKHRTGLVLMHSRGDFATLHTQEPVLEIIPDVMSGLVRSFTVAIRHGVKKEQVVLDIGLGFGKTQAQNLELIAKLGKLKDDLDGFPFLVGASRKSFIGKLLDGAVVQDRLLGSVAAAVVAVWNGADIVRAHDVRETVEAIKVVNAIRKQI
jgi:dihydropteroate synthase